MKGYNRANKLVSIFKEKEKWITGVNGTSEWYSFTAMKEALNKYNELLESDISL